MIKKQEDVINHSEIVRQFKKILEVVEWWRTSSGAMSTFRGREVKAISQDVFDALDSLAAIGGLPNDAFHPGARAIGLAVTEFAKAWINYVDRAQSGDDVHPGGDSAVWNTFEQINVAATAQLFRKPEPVVQLIQQDKVEAWQVAKIYGWVDDRGNPDPTKVQEELDKPGTHYDPKTWVHPSQKAAEVELADQWLQRTLVNVPVSMEKIESEAAKVAAPESLDTLIQQRVSIEQICKMKDIDQEAVERRAGELGIVLADARHIYPASPQVAIEEAMLSDETNKAEFEADQKAKAAERKRLIGDRIRELRQTGKQVNEINSIIASEFPS